LSRAIDAEDLEELVKDEDMPEWFGAVHKRGGEGAADGERAAKQLATDAKKIALAGAKGGKDTLNQLVVALGKLVLINSRELADLVGSVYKSFLVPEGSLLAQAGIRAGMLYNEKITELRKRKETDDSVDMAMLGPPFITVFIATLLAMRKKAQNDAKVFLDTLWNEEIHAQPKENVAKYVRYFRRRKPKGQVSKKMQGMERLQICIDTARDEKGRKLEEYLAELLAAENAVEAYGSAPRGTLERDAVRLLGRLSRFASA